MLFVRISLPDKKNETPDYFPFNYEDALVRREDFFSGGLAGQDIILQLLFSSIVQGLRVKGTTLPRVCDFLPPISGKELIQAYFG